MAPRRRKAEGRLQVNTDVDGPVTTFHQDPPNVASIFPNPQGTQPTLLPDNDGVKLQETFIQAVAWNYEMSDISRAPHRVVWEQAWRYYNNQWDWSEKEDWQSQRSLPKITMAVERLSASLSRIISTSKDWFGVTTENTKKEKYVNLVKHLMKFSLNHERVGFTTLFSRTLKSGLLSQIMPTMVTYESEGWANPEFEAPSDQASTQLDPDTFSLGAFGESVAAAPTEIPGTGKPVSFLRIEMLNPDRVLKDPTGRDRFIMIERTYTKGEFAAEADSRNFLNKEAVLREDYAAVTMQARDAQKKVQPTTPLMNDNVYIMEFWGDLYDMHGNLLMKNSYMLIANKKHVCIPPTPNPFWHGKIPIICPGLLDVPFSVYHKSLIGISLDSFTLWVDFLNLVIDYFQMIFIGVKELDMNLLHPDEDGDDVSVYPGAILKKKGQGKLLENTQFNEPSQQVWQFLQTLKAEMYDGSALEDASEGTPRTRGKMSAMESSKRMADAGQLLDFVFQSIEEGWIKKILTLSYQTLLQYMPQDDWAQWIDNRADKFPELADDLEMLKGLTPRERYKLLAQELEFQCRVFSAIFDRQQEIEKITFMLGVLGKIPDAAAQIKWPSVLGKLFEAFGWDKEEMLNAQGQAAQGGQGPPKPTPQGSDGGDEMPSQAPGSNQMEGQSAAILGGSEGKLPPEFSKLMPGARQPGNPRNIQASH